MSKASRGCYPELWELRGSRVRKGQLSRPVEGPRGQRCHCGAWSTPRTFRCMGGPGVWKAGECAGTRCWGTQWVFADVSAGLLSLGTTWPLVTTF